jgi:SAM-dependent methyltransferase
MDAQDSVSTEDNSTFEPLYAGRAPIQGMGMKFGFAPWDIKEPQPSVVQLEQAGGFHGLVLDAGCGRGENTIHLASRGHLVTGFDSSPTAIDQARERAVERGTDVRFVVADATEMEGLSGGFATVLDYGLYHCLDDDQRRRYAAALHRVCKAGADLHLFSFSETAPPGLPPAWLRVGRDNLRTNLESHWHISSIEETTSTTTFTREILEREREKAPGRAAFDPGALAADELGRILLPMWHVHAQRV